MPGVLHGTGNAAHGGCRPAASWAGQANNLRAPGYTLLGLQACDELPNGVLLFVDARKAGTRIFYPGEGRGVYAGVRATF